MSVQNKAHVDAQFPLVTEIRSQSALASPDQKRVPMTILVGSNGGVLGMGTEKGQTSYVRTTVKTTHGDPELVAHVEAL
jgi:hypothetical protein